MDGLLGEAQRGPIHFHGYFEKVGSNSGTPVY